MRKKRWEKLCEQNFFFYFANKNVLLVLYLYHPLFPFWIVGPFQCGFFSLILYLLLALSFYLFSFFCICLPRLISICEVEIQNLKWNKSGIAENTFRCAFFSFFFFLSSSKKVIRKTTYFPRHLCSRNNCKESEKEKRVRKTAVKNKNCVPLFEK